MTLNLLATIMIMGFSILIAMIFYLNLKIHHVFYDLDTKMDRMNTKMDNNFASLDAKMDRLAQESRDRDDNLALRIDELYRGLLKKAA